MNAFARILSTAAFAFACAQAAQALEPDVLGGLRVRSLYAPACEAIAYQAVSAYQSPGGLRVGKLVLDHPEYVKVSQPQCSFQPKVELQPEGLNRTLSVAAVEVSYEEPAMAVLEVRRMASGTWYRGQAENVLFWIRAEDAENTRFLSYERQLVSGVGLLSEACDELGRCQPLPRDVQVQADQAGAERADSCYANAYEFVSEDGPSVVTLPTGRKAYRIRLAATLLPKYGKQLPAELLVPTYDYQGRWTGFFFPRGC